MTRTFVPKEQGFCAKGRVHDKNSSSYIPVHINILKLFVSPLCAYSMPAQDPHPPALYSRLLPGSTSSVSCTSSKRT